MPARTFSYSPTYARMRGSSSWGGTFEAGGTTAGGAVAGVSAAPSAVQRSMSRAVSSVADLVMSRSPWLRPRNSATRGPSDTVTRMSATADEPPRFWLGSAVRPAPRIRWPVTSTRTVAAAAEGADE